MRGLWILLVGFGACVQPPAATPTPPVLVVPACAMLALGESWTLLFATSTAGEVVIEVERPNGGHFVAYRQRLSSSGQATAELDEAAFALGTNRVTVWVRTDAQRTAERSFAVEAYDTAGAPLVDADGDCAPSVVDCNDDAAAVSPFTTERCDDDVDNDCDGLVDRAELSCAATCPDSDGDGATRVACGGTDCDDGDGAVHPGASELCDGRDNDCDGALDESFDADGDNFVRCPQFDAVTTRVDGSACPAGYARCADCDDGDANIYPGAYANACAQ